MVIAMPETEKFYTADEIADILRITEDSVTRLLRTKKMPGYKFQGIWRVDKEEFWQYVAEQRNIQIETKDK